MGVTIRENWGQRHYCLLMINSDIVITLCTSCFKREIYLPITSCNLCRAITRIILTCLSKTSYIIIYITCSMNIFNSRASAKVAAVGEEVNNQFVFYQHPPVTLVM